MKHTNVISKLKPQLSSSHYLITILKQLRFNFCLF